MSEHRKSETLHYSGKPEPTTPHWTSTKPPGRVDNVLASVALFVLRLMRSKVPLNHVRLEWFCTCGVQMCADYPDAEDMAEFKEGLGNAQERPPSLAQIVGVEDRMTLLGDVFPIMSALTGAFAFTAALILPLTMIGPKSIPALGILCILLVLSPVVVFAGVIAAAAAIYVGELPTLLQ